MAKKLKGGRYDLVSRPDAERHHREQERVGAAGTGDAVLRAGARREGFFEQDYLGPHDVLPVIEDRLNAAIDRRFDALVLGL